VKNEVHCLLIQFYTFVAVFYADPEYELGFIVYTCYSRKNIRIHVEFQGFLWQNAV
jgi:hypothetical protein